MQPFKIRIEPVEIKILRILSIRMELTVEAQMYYLNKKKGFEGEVQLDLWTEKLQSEGYILNDLQLETNNSIFQLDSPIIYQETKYFFEVKNYEGDFRHLADSFEALSGKEIRNPLDQLNEVNLYSANYSKTLDLIFQ